MLLSQEIHHYTYKDSSYEYAGNAKMFRGKNLINLAVLVSVQENTLAVHLHTHVCIQSVLAGNGK